MHASGKKHTKILRYFWLFFSVEKREKLIQEPRPSAPFRSRCKSPRPRTPSWYKSTMAAQCISNADIKHVVHVNFFNDSKNKTSQKVDSLPCGGVSSVKRTPNPRCLAADFVIKEGCNFRRCCLPLIVVFSRRTARPISEPYLTTINITARLT
jgi:hypothetical protein